MFATNWHVLGIRLPFDPWYPMREISQGNAYVSRTYLPHLAYDISTQQNCVYNLPFYETIGASYYIVLLFLDELYYRAYTDL